MPDLPVFKAGDFNPARPSRVVQVDPINIAGPMQTLSGASMERARDEAIERGRKDAIQDSMKNPGKLMQRDGGMFADRWGNEAYNKQSGLAFRMHKEQQLREKMDQLELDHQFDEQGFETEAGKYQTEFFRDVSRDNVDVFDATMEMWNRYQGNSKRQIRTNVFRKKKEQDAIVIGQGLDQKINDIEKNVYTAGYGESPDDELTAYKANVDLAVEAGSLTTEQGAKLYESAVYKITKANYLWRVNGGENVDGLVREIDTREGLNAFRLDQRQAIQGEVRARSNLLKAGSEKDRIGYDIQLKRLERLFLRGEGTYDPDLIGSTMRQKGYRDLEIETRLGELGFSAEVGRDVKILETGNFEDGARIVEDARDWAENHEGDSLEQDRAWTRYEELQKAQAAKLKAYQSDAWGAESAYNPDWLKSYQDEQGNWKAGALDEAHEYLVWKTGDTTIPPMPKRMLQSIRAGLNAAETSEQKATILGGLLMSNPKRFDRIADNEDVKLTPGERAAAEFVRQGRMMEATTVLLAEDRGDELLKLYGDKDRNDAFDIAFPDAGVFADADQAAMVRGNFNNLHRFYMKRGLTRELAATKAAEVLTAGYEQKDVNGDLMLVPKGTNTDQINTTLDRLSANPGRFGLRLGEDQGHALEREIQSHLGDSTRTQLVPYDGGYLIMDVFQNEAYTQQTPQGRQMVIVERDGTLRGIPSGPEPAANHRRRSDWGGAVEDVAPEMVPLPDFTIPQKRAAGYQGPPVIKNRKELEPVLATALRANDEADRAGLKLDVYIDQITRDPNQADYLQGVSAVIRSGKMPEWTLGALAASGVPEFKRLESEAIRKQVMKRWNDPDQRTRMTNGVRESPLQALRRIIQDVETARKLDRTGPRAIGGTGFRSSWMVPEVTEPLMTALGDRERGAKGYKAVNTLGYLGKYQFGAVALADLNIIDKNALEGRTNKEILNDPARWKHGLRMEAFLADPELQDKLMRKWIGMKYRELDGLGVVDSTSTDAEIAGYIAAAHIGGAGGARKLKRGRSMSDDYGGSTKEYYDLGYKALRKTKR